MTFDKLCNSILERAFHGTPHDIVGSFDMQKIGTGEGNMAYGWGAYTAESMEVANTYRKGLKHRDFINKVRNAYDEGYDPQEAEEALMNAGLDEKEMALVKALQKEDWWGFDYPHQAVNAALKEPDSFEYGEETDNAIKNFGNLYEFNILADKENDFLDWNKPLSEQNENVQRKCEHAYSDRYSDSPLAPMPFKDMRKNYGTEPNGSYIYHSVGNDPKDSSLRLLKHGIKGIKYLDQGSRGVGEGTYNYVIFDPKIIQIVAKNGEFVMSGKKPEMVSI